MAYAFEGKMLEVCSCNVICPCWAGQDPDGGTCEGVLVYHIDRGTIDGVHVSGLNYAILLHLPGNILQGNWRIVVYVDDKATDAQYEALLKALTGKLGGPLADIAQLVGEVAGVERADITFEFEQGHGRLQVGPTTAATVEPLRGATGQPMAMHDTVFTTIPGSPAYVGKAQCFEPMWRSMVSTLTSKAIALSRMTFALPHDRDAHLSWVPPHLRGGIPVDALQRGTDHHGDTQTI